MSGGIIGDHTVDWDDYAWTNINTGQDTRDVGTKKPNALGLYDMSGNVYEWNFDLELSTTYRRVIRGGSWLDDASNYRIGFWGSYNN